MKTREIVNPRVGMMVYAAEPNNLMAMITSIDGQEFDFHVHNGRWSGSFKDGKIDIYLPDGEIDTVDCVPFVEVAALSREEANRWYTYEVIEVPEAEHWSGPVRIDSRSVFILMAGRGAIGEADKAAFYAGTESYNFAGWDPRDPDGYVYIGQTLDEVIEKAAHHIAPEVDEEDSEIAF